MHLAILGLVFSILSLIHQSSFEEIGEALNEITPNLPFSEFNFYELYRETFEKSELGRMKKLLPLREMAESFGLVRKSMMPKRGRKSYFTPEGKVALMFLKMKTQMSFPK